ncbi:MAG: glycosyl transferase family 1 [Myxococcaceae bacterium]|nr:glycosyl transferase family 1 [Myxococcaceae bacterium]
MKAALRQDGSALTVLNVAYPLAPVGPDAVGGAEQILTALDATLVRRGHRSLVLACAGSVTRGELFAAPGLAPPLTPARHLEAQRQHARTLRSILRRERVDLIHFHGIDFHGYLPDTETPMLATLHLPPSWYPRERLENKPPHLHLHCVSASQRRRCPTGLALLDDIPNGVDLTHFGQASARPPTRAGHALVLGRICPEKGIHLALEAAHRADVELRIGGQVFPYPEHVRYFEEQVLPQLDARRRFLGPLGQAQKIEELSRARCLLVPSLAEETSSLVTLEALACGTPVIAFARGALPELVQPGRNGFLVDDVVQMARALAQVSLLSHDVCRASAAAFDQEIMCARYLAVYDRLSCRVTRARARCL